LLTGPVGPDGDSIGACLALALGIRAMCGATVIVAGRPSFRYSSLPGAEMMVPDGDIQSDFDLVVVLDGDRHRLEPEIDRAFKAARLRGIIDHHGSTTPDGYDLVILDGTSASTCQMIYGLLEIWEVPLNAALAELIYAGLIFDTGGFRHPNTDPDAHRLAAILLETGFDHSSLTQRILSERTPAALALLARVIQGAWRSHGSRVQCGVVSCMDLLELGALLSDVEGTVELLLDTTGVELAVLFVERAPGVVKLSFRSRGSSDLHVARLASSLSEQGGGHARAAGAVLQEDLESCKEMVRLALDRIL
jgi:phosphoesterase RecJ-like protein